MKNTLIHCSLLLLLPAIAGCVEPRAPGLHGTDGADGTDSAEVAKAGPNAPAVPTPEEAPLEPGPEFDRTALGEIRGAVRVDGSSTVFPITELVAGVVESLAPNIDVGLGVSGTGGGFQKFCRGEVQIANASRPIKAAEEALCAEHGVDFIEVPVAFDGVSVVVHADNPWASCMTLAELKTLWRPEAEGRVESWSDVRHDWPGRPIKLYAPGQDSGTFDYFTRAVVGRERSEERV